MISDIAGKHGAERRSLRISYQWAEGFKPYPNCHASHARTESWNRIEFSWKERCVIRKEPEVRPNIRADDPTLGKAISLRLLERDGPSTPI